MSPDDTKKSRSRTSKRLSALSVKAATKPGIYLDGDGLMLRVTESGRKWLFRYTSPISGKRREMGLGTPGKVSLAAAREAVLTAHDLIAKKIDPIDDAERKKQERLAEAKKGTPKTFGQFADEWLAANESAFRNDKHRAQWRTTIEGTDRRAYAAPLRDKIPAAITTQDVLDVLQPIWLEIPETAKRVQNRIEQIMDAARAKGLYVGENPARWRGHLAKLIKARPKHEKGHHAALPYKDLPAFIVDLRARTGIAARALEFLILTAARSGEVRGATWAEIDINDQRWTVPCSRMKAGREHRVPLTDRAVAILTDMAALLPAGDNGSALVFPGDEKSGRRKSSVLGPVQMSDMTLAAVLKRMGRKGITVHGFRSTFQDWAEEEARFPASAVEAALAHVIGGTRASYRRGDSYDMRAELMAVWENYLNSGTARGNVIKMHRETA
ncbi:MAG: integrase arm-type DNA-binding domain-containing protein [Brucellaceae bacterium]|nr:integrase arm-type DNA-binding domain-containing protein [Brucellaceae bacterium]